MVAMQRYLTKYVQEDLDRKIIMLTGPRQSGKTTLSKMLRPGYDYFNYDNPDDRLALQKRSWDRSKALVIFDELHKLKNWKSWIKGIYDTEGIPPSILVTGSAKLDTYRKVGDSLAGRFFQFRLHPLDLKEICILLKDTEIRYKIKWSIAEKVNGRTKIDRCPLCQAETLHLIECSDKIRLFL